MGEKTEERSLYPRIEVLAFLVSIISVFVMVMWFFSSLATTVEMKAYVDRELAQRCADRVKFEKTQERYRGTRREVARIRLELDKQSNRILIIDTSLQRLRYKVRYQRKGR